MDSAVVIALITTGGTVVAALIAILPHLLKSNQQPGSSQESIKAGDSPGEPRKSQVAELPPQHLMDALNLQLVGLAPAAAPSQPAKEDEEAGNDQPASQGRREETMKVLFRHGRITSGTEIELMPQALSSDAVGADLSQFRVRIVNPPNRAVKRK